MNNFAICLSLIELFFVGVMFGYIAVERQDPNAPKPKQWEDKLHKEWMNGFRAGEKSTLKSVAKRLEHEEINRIPWNRGEDDG